MKLTLFLVTALSAVIVHGQDARRGEWMKDGKYGVFIHFLGTGPNWNERVDAFDVELIARQVRDCGAAYLIFTLGQNSGYYCSPNATYDRYTGRQPGERCSKRDLPGELADALARHGIRLILYLPSRSPRHDEEAVKRLGDVVVARGHERETAPQQFTKRWSEVIRKWSLRYEKKVAGWWFDGAFNTAGWDDLTKPCNWNTWAAACRAGNQDSMLAFNPGVGAPRAFSRLTAQQDYTAGELENWCAQPGGKRPSHQRTGPLPDEFPAPAGVQWHALSYMGSWWGRCDGPCKPDDWMVNYIAAANQQGGVVSIDVGISEKNGAIYPPHYRQLLAIGAELGTAQFVDVKNKRGAGKAIDIRHPGGTVERVTLYDLLPSVFVRKFSDDPWRHIVALCNPDPERVISVDLSAIGVAHDAICVGYDRSEEEFIGPIYGTLSRIVPAGSCRVVALRQVSGRPEILDTSYGTVRDSVDTGKVKWSSRRKTLEGSAMIMGGEPYQIRIVAPPEPARWTAVKAIVSEKDAKAGVTTDIKQTRQWVRVTIESEETRRVNWQVAFIAEPAPKPGKVDVALSAEPISANKIRITCKSRDRQVLIRRNDGVELIPDRAQFDDNDVWPETEYTYSAYPVTWTGRPPKCAATVTATTPGLPGLPPRPDVYISDLEPIRGYVGWGAPAKRDASIENNPIMIQGQRFRKGMGVHAKSELMYAVAPGYERFVAVVGIDDEVGDGGSVTFEVLVDDVLRHKTEVLRGSDPWAAINVEIPKGSSHIRLLVRSAGDESGDHADWAYAGFILRGQ